MAYSSQSIPTNLIDEIKDALQTVSYGSIEIYVQNKTVTQITVRNIKKTSVTIHKDIKDNPSISKQINSIKDPKIKVLTIKK